MNIIDSASLFILSIFDKGPKHTKPRQLKSTNSLSIFSLLRCPGPRQNGTLKYGTNPVFGSPQ
jgi:hypothetical protein